MNSPPQVLHETSWLDGLRGVAALLVVLQHEHAMVNMGLHRCYGHDDQTRSVAYWPVVRLLFSGGSFAVMVFFYISGKFLIFSMIFSWRGGGGGWLLVRDVPVMGLNSFLFDGKGFLIRFFHFVFL